MTDIDISLEAVERLACILDGRGGFVKDSVVVATLRALSAALTQSRAETAAAEARGMQKAADKLRLVGKDEYTNDFNRGFDRGIEWSRNTILTAIQQGDTTND